MKRGFACIGLEQAKLSVNIGGVLRAAGCFGASMVAVSGKRYQRASTDTGAAYKNLPLLHCDDLRTVIPFDCVPVAVELVPSARSLFDYEHPRGAFYVFGAEDPTLGERVLSWCRDVIYVPSVHCLNLAACVNVVLYDRAAKEQGRTP